MASLAAAAAARCFLLDLVGLYSSRAEAGVEALVVVTAGTLDD